MPKPKAKTLQARPPRLKKRTLRLKSPITLNSRDVSPGMAEVKYRRLVENMNEAVWVGNEKEITVYANPKFCELMGSSLEDIIGRPSYDFWTPESVKRVRKVNLQRKKGISSSYEGDLLTRSGKVIPVLLNGTPLPDGGTIGIMTDLREIRRKEKEVETLLKRLDFAVKGSQDGLWYAEVPYRKIRSDFDFGSYIWYSPRFKELFGYETKEVPNTLSKWLKHTHPDDVRHVINSIKKHLGSKTPFEIECRFRLKSGEYRWFSVRGEGLFGDKEKDTLQVAGSFRDIDPRKKAENALIASKKLFDDLVEGSPTATFVIDANHKVIYWNRALEELTGLRSDVMIGTDNHWQPFYPKKRMMITDMMIKGRKIKEILRYYKHMDVEESTDKKGIVGSVYFRHFRGQAKWLRVMAKPLRDHHNNIVGAVETVEDITERKLIVEALARRTREFQALYQVGAHTLMIQSLGRVLSDITKDIVLTCREPKFARSRIVFDGQTYATLKKGEKFVCKIEEPIIVADQKRGVMELGYVKKIKIDKAPPNLRGERRVLDMVARTFGKHVRSREIIERYEKLVKKSITGIYIVQNHRLQYVNPKFAKIFKYKEQELIGQTASDLILGCDCYNKFKENKKASSYNCTAKGRRKDGSMIDIEVVTQRTVYYGKPATLGTVQDVTKLKRAQEQLSNFNRELQEKIAEKTRDLQKANRRLLSLNELKDEFIAVTSHELRSPLTSIRGYLSFLVEDQLFEDIPERGQDYIRRVYANVKVLNNLVNNILDVSRIEMDRLELHQTPVDILNLVRTVIDNLKYQSSNKEIDIKLVNKLDTDELILSVDAVRIRQVLRNIIENAIKYSPRGKAIKIEISMRGIGFQISIIDQGVGIPKSQILEIFDKFKQANNSKTRYKGGAGLGLFIAKRIVELHGGMIWAESELKKGTTFNIQFPV